MDFVLSYNNNEETMLFPVLYNGSITLERAQDNPTFDGQNGQLQALGTTNLASFTIESIFPLHEYPFTKYGSWGADGWRYVHTINRVRERRIPFRAIYYDNWGRTIFNLPVSVETFEYGLDKAGDIWYRLEFREYRFAYTPAVENLAEQVSAEGVTVKVTTTVQTDSQKSEADSLLGMTMKSGNVVTSGTTVAVPSNVQTGVLANFTYWQQPKKGSTWTSGTVQRTLYDLWVSKGSVVSNGVATLRGKYLIAVTTKLGTTGDGLVVYFEGGKTLQCIVGDSKGSNPGSVWGHLFGSLADVIEWEYGNARSGNFTSDQSTLKAGLRALGIYGCKVNKVINYGSWLNQ